MGNKGGKNMKQKPVALKSSDIKFLTQQTGMSKDQIQNVYNKFMSNNPDGILDKNEFARLYDELRPESREQIDEIAHHVFRAFDKDNNGTINFNEFMVAYAMTSRGEPEKKLEFAFELYDEDNNGYLDRNELRDGLAGMLDLLGANKKNTNVAALVDECMKDLDASHDGKVAKNEFVQGLAKNYSLRALMSPFN